MKIPYRYVYEDVDRHGNVRVYYWKPPGPKIRIREPVGSEGFAKLYHELSNGTRPGPVQAHRPKTGTLAWLVGAYAASPAFRELEASSQRIRRQILDHCCREPIAPGRAETFADFPLERITTKALRVLRDRKADAPEAANGRVKSIRVLFAWAHANEHIATNPARDLERVKHASTGAKAWTVEDVAQFEKRHPIGTKAHLALALMLYTGMRRSDAVQLGRQHVKDGWISKPQHKGRKRHPHRIEIPLLAPLAAVLEASPKGDLTFLVTEHGRPFTIAGFGNWFRDRCKEAGLDGLSPHGLRKAGATRAADAGASAHTLMAMFGWRSLAEAELYTKAADRKRLAREGMALIGPLAGSQESGNFPTRKSGENERPKKSLKIKA